MDNTAPANELQLYTVKEVASLLSISKNRVYELIYAKRIAAMDIGGLKIQHSALANFLRGMNGKLIDFKHPENVYCIPEIRT